MRRRAAAAVAALVALSGLAGAGGYLAVREDPSPPTTATTTTTRVPDAAVVAEMAAALRRDLTVALTDAQARCVAAGVVAVVDRERLEVLAGAPVPLARLTDEERQQLLQATIACLDPATAAELLAPTTTAPTPLEALPDEGG